MKAKELKNALKNVDDDREVELSVETPDGFYETKILGTITYRDTKDDIVFRVIGLMI